MKKEYKDKVIHFGKFEGTAFVDAPFWWLHWMLNNKDSMKFKASNVHVCCVDALEHQMAIIRKDNPDKYEDRDDEYVLGCELMELWEKREKLNAKLNEEKKKKKEEQKEKRRKKARNKRVENALPESYKEVQEFTDSDDLAEYVDDLLGEVTDIEL